MRKKVDSYLINYFANKWESPRDAQEIQEISEAIVAEIKQDYRDHQRRHGRSPEAEAFFEGLICDVQSPEFWQKLDYILGFEFDY